MKTFALVLSTALCLSVFPALAGSPASHDGVITLAQADVRIGPGGVSIGERDRDGDHDRRRERDRVRVGEDRDRHCKTVTVEEDGHMRKTKRCDD